MASGTGGRPLPNTTDQEKSLLNISDFKVTSVTGTSTAKNVNITVGSFTMGILVGYHRTANNSTKSGLAVIYYRDNIVTLGPKIGLDTVTGVSYSDGVLTVSSTTAYMSYAFLKLPSA